MTVIFGSSGAASGSCSTSSSGISGAGAGLVLIFFCIAWTDSSLALRFFVLGLSYCSAFFSGEVLGASGVLPIFFASQSGVRHVSLFRIVNALEGNPALSDMNPSTSSQKLSRASSIFWSWVVSCGPVSAVAVLSLDFG